MKYIYKVGGIPFIIFSGKNISFPEFTSVSKRDKWHLYHTPRKSDRKI